MPSVSDEVKIMHPHSRLSFHTLHAGLHKIDCKFCHDGARRSKQSVIPGAGTCVNCHKKAIKKGSRYGTEEITKIFVSAGFDPSKDKYIENYDQLSNEEIGKIYKDWIGTNWMKQNEVTSISEAGQSEIDQQWARIVKSMTSNTKQTLSPIEWVRLHNLPDYVYFNHSQHVTVGKLVCQTCHGKVEEMDVMKQYSTLSMGWCINCHRQSDVQFKIQ